MACTITALDQTLKECIEAIGGLKLVSMIARSEVDGATVAAGKISAFTVSGTWKVFRFDRDKTSFAQATTERPSLNRSHKIIDGLMKFADPTDDDVVAMNNIDCCVVVCVMVGNNDKKVVFGVQLNRAGDDIEDPFVSCKINGDYYMPAGDEEARIEYKFTGQQRNLPPYTGDEASIGVV